MDLSAHLNMDALNKALQTAKSEYYEYEGMTMTSSFPAKNLDRIKEMVFHDDDVLVATYPKSGTTWMQEIVSHILNDGDADEVNKIPLVVRYIFIEADLPGFPNAVDTYNTTPPPHLVKSHLPSGLLSKAMREGKTKVIVVLRNPKDTLVSYFHFYRTNKDFQFKGNWEDFWQLFKEKKLCFGDVYEVNRDWWRLRDNPRLLVIKYEDMLKTPEESIKKVAEHLGKSFSEETIHKIALNTSFKAMKANPAANYDFIEIKREDDAVPFMRKGIIGDWKNYLTEEQATYCNNLSKTILEPEGLFLEDC